MADKTVAFTINDIDLRIAPEAISVQKEDLVYTWRTLRTNQATKIPSGHGQALIQLRIPFIDSDILSLHRLIIEFRHSPFCFIENLWLRQELCPEWPLGQKMAFTLTSLDIVPYSQTSNAWVLNLELSWFNYFPYMHNWLYRRDWVTDWMSSGSGLEEPIEVQTTIGWEIDENGSRKPRINVINERLSKDSSAHAEWSILQEQYSGKNLSIDDFELLHRGVIFDLLPIPSRMEKAFFVPQPSESLIYVRYINHLQRDALLKNFDYDLEQELQAKFLDSNSAADIFRMLFSSIKRDNSEYVIGIDKFTLPIAIKELQSIWNQFQGEMRAAILQYKPGVEFGFASYKSVQLPTDIAQATQKAINKAKGSATPNTNNSTLPVDPWVYAPSNTKARIRRGLSNPKGFHTPVGNLDKTKRSFATLLHTINDDIHWRKEGQAVKGRPAGFHWGLDIASDPKFRDREGAAVYAVKAGRVVAVETGTSNSPLKRWKCIEKDTSGTFQFVTLDGDILDDFLLSAKTYLKGDTNRKKVGTVIRSTTNKDRAFFVDFGTGGRFVMLSHNEGKERSHYIHLSWINPEVISLRASGKEITEEQVANGFIIGTIGETYLLSTEFVGSQIFDNKADSLEIPTYAEASDAADDIDYSKVRAHLHFEYYERADWNSQRDPPNDEDLTISESSNAKGYIVVDARPTFQYAVDNGFDSYIDSVNISPSITLDTVAAQVESDPKLSESSQAAVVQILDEMYRLGYFYYDRQSDLTNVWWRPWRIAVQSVNPDFPDYDEVIKTDTVILTNISAGLRHIVANIPILGHEFPTHQHLGSIEPYYNLEFHLLDDSNTLEGLGESGGILSAMRFLLQHNARKFRTIPDSWCLLTDCFLTRLLGTFNVRDLEVALDQDDQSIVTDFNLVRRTIISRAQTETVEGNPGLSRLVFELQETNSYSDEALEIQAPKKLKVDEGRERILRAIYNLEFIDEYKDLAIKVLIAQLAGGNTGSPGDLGFGQFNLNRVSVIGDLEQLSKDNPVGYMTEYSAFALNNAYIDTLNNYNTAARVRHGEEVEGNVYVIRDDEKGFSSALQALGIPITSFNGSISPDQPGNNYIAISEKAVGLTEYAKQTNNNYTVYDISSLLKSSEENLLLGEIPIEKIQRLAYALRAILRTAEMYLSEESQLLESGNYSGTPLSKDTITESLYNLSVDPRLWRTFQYYLIKTGAYSYWPDLVRVGIGVSPETLSGARQNLASNEEVVRFAFESNPNWLGWVESAKLPNSTFNGVTVEQNIAGAFDLLLAVSSPVVTTVTNQLDHSWNSMKNVGRSFSALTSGTQAELINYWQANYNASTLSIVDNIVKHYVSLLPLLILATSEQIKDILEDSLFGNLFGGLTGSDERLPAIANTMSRLKETILSCGHFGPHPWNSNFPFFLEPNSIASQDIDLSDQVENPGSLINSSLVISNPSLTYKPVPAGILETAIEEIPLRSLTGSWLYTENEYIQKAGLPLPGSPFEWRVDKEVELEKVRYLRQLLARLADEALQDPGVLKAFGLEDLALINRRNIEKGKEAYPDLKLPYHPYYNDPYAVYPDFYMWNIYEDGDIINNDLIQDIQSGVGFILKNCYKSLGRLQDGETSDNAYKPSRDKMVLDESFDEPVALNIKYVAEGSDGTKNKSGPTAFPFYPTTESESSINTFFNSHQENIERAKSDAQKIAESAAQATRASTKNTATSTYRNQLSGIVTNNLKLTNTQEGVQYPSRLSADQYKSLQNKVNSITSMFGSRAGYLQQDDLPTDISQRLDGTPLERDKQPSHKFDLDALQQLADNSTYDLFTQKRRLAKAYPTFKLYFIEEDEWESRLLNFDDFYSYNGVKDFTVTSSRKIPGDVAVITLQNVSGILDGTKRDAVVDLDYFSQKLKNTNKQEFADTPDAIGTAEEQPFGALVLRPGLNVQLRAGYSNDPDNLTVLINGRVVDVQWNQQGDLAQIMVQSFGTELTQVLKNSQPDINSDPYYTTHQLLGALLLEPELVHFGRWEFGQLYQIGEAKDSRFDFFDYSKEANFGRFEYSTKAVQWFFRHPIVMYGLALGGVGLLSKLPGAGRVFSRVSRWGTRFNFVDKTLAKLSVAPKFGQAFNKVLGATGIFGRLGTNALEKELIAETARRGAVGIITVDSKISTRAARQFIEEITESLATRAGSIGSKQASLAFGSDLAAAVRTRGDLVARELERIAIRSPEELTIGRVAKSVDALEDEVATQLLKGQWFADPYSAVTGLQMIKEITPRAAGNIVRGATTGVSKLLLGTAIGVAAVENIINPLASEIYDATIGRVQKYFQASKISIMLSPQDDNLYPPHPKDYMVMNQGAWNEFKRWFTFSTSTAITGSEEVGNLVGHYFHDADPFDKRAPVESYQYNIINSYIWDVLYEMSLRHPGWIHAVRPYGTQFRYTLFFGVPSQRYWAQPADNLFINRINKVARFLDNDITIDEYRSLYGDKIGGIDLTEYDEKLIEAAGEDPTGSKIKALRNHVYTSKALEEYMHGLNLRFVPFRRYHSISSEVDLIWNGIMGSENASYNAVDVTYFPEDTKKEVTGPEGSTVIKAHAFLPENMLRVKPMQPYPNCRGYTMAMRYGMGELLFSLRDMYRGEILTLGNPRIMPWDIVILHDTYNSMVGPIEVEQVVHNFSHETGFITEIKPSAVVLANETSSWPLLEAMKLVSLAVRNVEQDALGLTADSFGTLGAFGNWLVDHGPGGDNPDYNDYAKRKMSEIFGEYWDTNTESFTSKSISDIAYGKDKPGEEAVKKINDVADGVAGVAGSIGYLGAIASVGLGYAALKNKLPFGRSVLFGESAIGKLGRVGTGAASVGGLATSSLAITADYLLDPPQLMSLLGGSLLLLQCLRGDTIMVVPLMKNGYPIVAGLNYHDPSMIWKNFLGDLGRFVDDVLDGSRDLANLWSIYGSYAWRRLPNWSQITTDSNDVIQGVDLTGAL